jgi:hypothetical protein
LGRHRWTADPRRVVAKNVDQGVTAENDDGELVVRHRDRQRIRIDTISDSKTHPSARFYGNPVTVARDQERHWLVRPGAGSAVLDPEIEGQAALVEPVEALAESVDVLIRPEPQRERQGLGIGGRPCEADATRFNRRRLERLSRSSVLRILVTEPPPVVDTLDPHRDRVIDRPEDIATVRRG